MRGLRRSQHHQRRKEAEAADQPASAPRHWSPWKLASNGTYYWSALRLSDGSTTHAYCDAQGTPINTIAPNLPQITYPIISVSRAPSISCGCCANPPATLQRPVSSSAISTDASTSSSSPSSYISLWYRDLQQHEGSVGERTKLDMRVTRWLASLGEVTPMTTPITTTATTASLMVPTAMPTARRPHVALQHSSSVPMVRHSGLCSVYA